jgi:hypothetical protein
MLSDPRAADALDLLESLQLPDGRFQATRAWWQAPTRETSAVDVIDWGKGRPSEALTLHALRVLKAAGRREVYSGATTGRPASRAASARR